MMNSAILEALNEIDEKKIIRATISNKKNEICNFKKINIRKANNNYFVERLTEKQAFHETVTPDKIMEILQNELNENFKQLNITSAGLDYEIKISKKGKVLKNKKKNNHDISELSKSFLHNRKKNYIFEEGIFVPALFELGIMTESGKIITSKYDKFKQINRFAECVDDALKNCSKDSLEIIDFGCGKSYLTFVLYYYITEIKKIRAHITGLDLKKDVIEKCRMTAEKYKYAGLDFICADIKDYVPETAPDMVVTLHACDTATDYALYNAISWNSKYIFSVPCCQHELNSKINLKNFSILSDHGLIKERFSALATDAIRAKILELCGYKTDILEFIDIENSPKNLLIRAEKNKLPNEYKQRVIEAEIKKFTNELGAEITLQNLIFLK